MFCYSLIQIVDNLYTNTFAVDKELVRPNDVDKSFTIILALKIKRLVQLAGLTARR